MGRLCGNLGTREEGLEDIKYGKQDVLVWDEGRQIQGRGGHRDVNECLFLRENVLFMVSIRFHRPEPLCIPYDVYTKYFRI